MKHLSFIIAAYVLSTGCRSSYDETKRKPEITAQTGSSNAGPIVEMPNVNPTASAGSTTGASAGTGAASGTTTGNGNTGSTVTGGEDPGSLRAEHDASAEELKKYNCKGTALITDSGMDDNKDGILQDDEIQETRIDCTEVVPGATTTVPTTP